MSLAQPILPPPNQELIAEAKIIVLQLQSLQNEYKEVKESSDFYALLYSVRNVLGYMESFFDHVEYSLRKDYGIPNARQAKYGLAHASFRYNTNTLKRFLVEDVPLLLATYQRFIDGPIPVSPTGVGIEYLNQRDIAKAAENYDKRDSNAVIQHKKQYLAYAKLQAGKFIYYSTQSGRKSVLAAVTCYEQMADVLVNIVDKAEKALRQPRTIFEISGFSERKSDTLVESETYSLLDSQRYESAHQYTPLRATEFEKARVIANCIRQELDPIVLSLPGSGDFDKYVPRADEQALVLAEARARVTAAPVAAPLPEPRGQPPDASVQVALHQRQEQKQEPPEAFLDIPPGLGLESQGLGGGLGQVQSAGSSPPSLGLQPHVPPSAPGMQFSLPGLPFPPLSRPLFQGYPPPAFTYQGFVNPSALTHPLGLPQAYPPLPPRRPVPPSLPPQLGGVSQLVLPGLPQAYPPFGALLSYPGLAPLTPSQFPQWSVLPSYPSSYPTTVSVAPMAFPLPPPIPPTPPPQPQEWQRREPAVPVPPQPGLTLMPGMRRPPSSREQGSNAEGEPPEKKPKKDDEPPSPGFGPSSS